MRLAAQKTALTLAFRNPLFGIGLDNFRTEEVRYSGLGVYQSAENSYLQILVEGGSFYFLLFILLVGWCLRRLVWGRRLDPFYGPALKLAWVAILLMSATIYTETEYVFNIFAGLLFSYGLHQVLPTELHDIALISHTRPKLL
jgi:O-antigen ligase